MDLFFDNRDILRISEIENLDSDIFAQMAEAGTYVIPPGVELASDNQDKVGRGPATCSKSLLSAVRSFSMS